MGNLLIICALIAILVLSSRRRETPEQRANRKTIEYFPHLQRESQQRAKVYNLESLMAVAALLFAAAAYFKIF